MAGLNPSDPNQDPDVALMLAFQSGQEEAFVQLYRRHRDRMVNFSRRMLGSAAEGEEAAQEVFLKLYNARRSYVPRSRFSTYLFRIATNHCINLKQRHATRRRDPETNVEQQAAGNRSPEQDSANMQLRAAINKALATLPHKQAAAFTLCHFEGLAYQEAAAVLDTSEGAVKSLVHRARESLMRELSVHTPQTREAAHALR